MLSRLGARASVLTPAVGRYSAAAMASPGATFPAGESPAPASSWSSLWRSVRWIRVRRPGHHRSAGLGRAAAPTTDRGQPAPPQTSLREAREAEHALLRYAGLREAEVRDVPCGPSPKHTMHTVSCGSPDAPPMVLLHGYAAGIGFYFKNLAPLSHHFRLHAVDWLGWGLSGRPPFNARRGAWPGMGVHQPWHWQLPLPRCRLAGLALLAPARCSLCCQVKHRCSLAAHPHPALLPPGPPRRRRTSSSTPSSGGARRWASSASSSWATPWGGTSPPSTPYATPSASRSSCSWGPRGCLRSQPISPPRRSASAPTCSPTPSGGAWQPGEGQRGAERNACGGEVTVGVQSICRSLMVSVFPRLWNAGVTPGAVVRLLGPVGRSLTEGYTSRRFVEGHGFTGDPGWVGGWVSVMEGRALAHCRPAAVPDA